LRRQLSPSRRSGPASERCGFSARMDAAIKLGAERPSTGLLLSRGSQVRVLPGAYRGISGVEPMLALRAMASHQNFTRRGQAGVKHFGDSPPKSDRPTPRKAGAALGKPNRRQSTGGQRVAVAHRGPVLSPSAQSHGLRNRRSEVRILSGALGKGLLAGAEPCEMQGRTAPPASHSTGRNLQGHAARCDGYGRSWSHPGCIEGTTRWRGGSSERS